MAVVIKAWFSCSAIEKKLKIWEDEGDRKEA
jgi:hypothetical protein